MTAKILLRTAARFISLCAGSYLLSLGFKGSGTDLVVVLNIGIGAFLIRQALA